MAWDENNFDDRLSNLKKTWETGKRIGLPTSEAEKVWGLLSLELEFSGKPLAELKSVAWFALQWMETRKSALHRRCIPRLSQCRDWSAADAAGPHGRGGNNPVFRP